MLHYIYGHELARFPRLAQGMFADRRRQFGERLGWPVTLDADGGERDAYDTLDPLYLIREDGNGGHAGSMRFLPTTGRTMLNEHFAALTGGGRIESPLIWECTRFCLAPGADRRVAPALMLGAAELGLAAGLTHAVGVFDARMLRVYRALGWVPDVLGRGGDEGAPILAGLWAFTPEVRARMARRAARAGVAGVPREAPGAGWLPRVGDPAHVCRKWMPVSGQGHAQKEQAGA